MGAHTSKKWITITLAATIIPLSLLTAFKMTGIIPEPQTPLIIQREPIFWSMERPSFTTEAIDESVENACADGEIAVQMVLGVAAYRENPSIMEIPYVGRDGVPFSTKVNVSIFQGFSVSVTIKYSMDTNSTLCFNQNSWALTLQNVTLTSIENPYAYGAECKITGKPSDSSYYLEIWSNWMFGDPNSEDHELSVVLEILYCNGTAYCKVILPTQLHIWVDAGNNFDDAKQTDVGNFTDFLDDRNDIEDYYRIWMEEGKTIRVQMIHQTNIDFDLYLYDLEENLLAHSSSKLPSTTEVLVHTAETSG